MRVKITSELKVLAICFSQYIDRVGNVVDTLSAMHINRDTAYSHRKHSLNYREKRIGDTLYIFYGSYMVNDVEMSMIIDAYLAGKFTKYDTGDWD